MRLVVRFLAADHGDDQLATTSSSVRRSPSTSAVARALISPSRGLAAFAVDGRVEVGRHLLEAAEDSVEAGPGLCWKFPSISAKSRDQALELLMVRGGHAEHLGRHDGRQRVGEIAP